MSLLEINGLVTEFKTPQGTVRAVRDVSYRLERGEILGIVGESGSGKSVGMLSLMGLIAENGRVAAGELLFDGEDLSPVGLTTPGERQKHDARMRQLRGNEMAMIFQDPMTYLNPVLKIGSQITESIRLHLGYDRAAARELAADLLARVGISSPRERLRQYPYELSGGMRQRVIIAIALSCNPKLLIADEPTTALDVTVQAQLLELISRMARESGTSVIMITHDLGIVASMCDRIAIMYAGEIVEEGATDEIFYSPKHPYTVGLLGSVAGGRSRERQSLRPIPGTPPDLLKLPRGCAFTPRCPEAMRICPDFAPVSTEHSETQRCRCWKYCRDSAREMVEARAMAEKQTTAEKGVVLNG
ncbi:MAG: ABC transporter ATP-binding protein [Oscillospiraceae bacterium]|jgi:oligopeptide transport system ATP-binding protein|nr:ABC transporter ATP-binding protein [Oscillospiraceae bacterium]